MLNQSFTADNLRKIFDYENRRGVYLEARFFPEVEKLTKNVKTLTTTIRELRQKKRTPPDEAYEKQLAALYEEKQRLKDKKELLLEKELESISSEAEGGNFLFGLRKVVLRSGKTAFAMDTTPVAYFAMKQVQDNFQKLYKVKQSNRFEILCQLKSILGDSFPKYVIRTDINAFYESISQDKLLKIIDTDALLTFPSRKIIRRVLEAYRDLAPGQKGIPRGVGISAYLAELYMRGFDSAIKSQQGVIYFARYVDDVVIVYCPEPNSSTRELLPFVKKQAERLDLELNPDKTFEYDLRKPQKCVMEYLGYEITFGNGSTRIGLNAKRKTRYETRIKRSFEAYKRRANFDERRARRLLIKRLEFLAGNTRLLNNKGRILVGVFYSNKLLTSADELKFLDTRVRAEIASLSATSLRQRLMKISFLEGFTQKRFRRFSARDLSQIVEPWEHET